MNFIFALNAYVVINQVQRGRDFVSTCCQTFLGHVVKIILKPLSMPFIWLYPSHIRLTFCDPNSFRTSELNWWKLSAEVQIVHFECFINGQEMKFLQLTHISVLFPYWSLSFRLVLPTFTAQQSNWHMWTVSSFCVSITSIIFISTDILVIQWLQIWISIASWSNKSHLRWSGCMGGCSW